MKVETSPVVNNITTTNANTTNTAQTANAANVANTNKTRNTSQEAKRQNANRHNTNNENTVNGAIQKPIDEKEIIQAIEKANKHIRTYDRKLEFSIHEVTKQIMVKVINTEDDTVIREIPSEKVLDMVAYLWKVAGILVDEKR